MKYSMYSFTKKSSEASDVHNGNEQLINHQTAVGRNVGAPEPMTVIDGAKPTNHNQKSLDSGHRNQASKPETEITSSNRYFCKNS